MSRNTALKKKDQEGRASRSQDGGERYIILSVRITEEQAEAVDKCTKDLMEQFPEMSINRSDAVRMMIRGVLTEIKKKPEWLRNVMRGGER